MVTAIESGWVVQEIAEEAYRFQREVELGERVVVGLNRFNTNEVPPIELHTPDLTVSHSAVKEVQELRRKRDGHALAKALDELKSVASEGGNTMPPTLDVVRAMGTVGEVSGALREVFGEWRAPNV